MSEYAKKSEIPTKVSAFENDAGYLTQHQDLSEYALKTEIPTVPTNVSAFNNDAGYLTEHQSLADYALKTELPTEYVKSATVQGNKLTLTNKDNTTVDFEPSGGGGSSLPVYPENNGNYNLAVEINNGIPTLKWIAITTVWQLPTKISNNLKLFQCATINKMNNELEVF